MRLEQDLLTLAAATGEDGGDHLIRALRPMLATAAPFHAGEVALARPIGFARWTLTDDDSAVACDDLLLRCAGEPLRIDDLPEACRFPRTRDRLAQAGLRSLLALPFGAAGGQGPSGAVVLAHRDGWGFAAASLRVLVPLARMAGLCLARAVTLTNLCREVEKLRTRKTDERTSALRRGRRASDRSRPGEEAP